MQRWDGVVNKGHVFIFGSGDNKGKMTALAADLQSTITYMKAVAFLNGTSLDANT